MSKKGKSSDITVRVIEQNKYDDTYNNYVIYGIKGTKINNVIMNTIRRCIIDMIPTYAFDKEEIAITKNSSIYNNDYMRLRLSQFPIINVDNSRETIEKSLELEYEANISSFEQKIEDIDIIKKKEEMRNLEKSQNFTMVVNVKNTSSSVLNVTTDTDGVKFYYRGKLTESPYKRKLLIIKLKPGEEFICNAASMLNIGMKYVNHMTTSVCVFAEPEPEASDEYKLNIESLKQIPEKELVIRACLIINKKLQNYLDIITDKIKKYESEKISDQYSIDTTTKDESNEESSSSTDINENTELEVHRIKGFITIENESHTFGNLISRMLQDHESILFAGYKIDHLLIKEATIGYKTDGTDILEIFNDSINEAISIYETLINKFEKL
jgi:DNA-directed RNA polymerase subunit L